MNKQNGPYCQLRGRIRGMFSCLNKLEAQCFKYKESEIIINE